MKKKERGVSYRNNEEKTILSLLAQQCSKKNGAQQQAGGLSSTEGDSGGRDLSARSGEIEAERILEQCDREGIKICTYEEAGYPTLLAKIDSAPKVLFFKGTHPKELKKRAVLSIVGSRKADGAGRTLAARLASVSAGEGVVVVSGLASGIDTAAHSGALRGGVHSGFPTIAVLGHGLARPVYPASNRTLSGEILDNGGTLLSHFLPDTPPFPSNFLNRNRLVAGLSMVTLIVQATSRSGSLSTARHARDEGREVFVAPGPFDSKLYEGSHELIRQGATLISSPNQLLTELGELYPEHALQGDAPETSRVKGDVRFQRLYEAFEQSAQLSYEQLQNIVSDEELLAQCLLELELGGLIKRLPGMQFIRTG